MMGISFRTLFNIGVVAALAVVVAVSLGFNSQARMFPLWVGVPTLLLAIVHAIIDFRESARAKVKAKKGKEPAPADDQEAKKVFAKEINVSLWVIGMFASLYLVGFLYTTFFYTFLCLKVRSQFPWKVSLGVAAGCWAFLYFLMVQLMDVGLYEGVVVLALRKAILGY
jgi:hypothetical protein